MSIEQLQQQAKLAYDHEYARRNIKHQMQNRLTVNHNGGVFKVTPELILFLNHYHNQAQTELVVLDAYENPIRANTAELYDLASKRYQEIMNEWELAWQEQIKIRSAANV
jgi:hypothetical protein